MLCFVGIVSSAEFKIMGAKGRVLRIDDSKDAIVDINGEAYVMNLDCLVLVCHDDSPLTTSHTPILGLTGECLCVYTICIFGNFGTKTEN